MTQPAASLVRAPVPIGMIASREDRFLCVPYRIVITANTCAQRQAAVRAGANTMQFSKCMGCSLGREVEARSGGEAPAPTKLRWNSIQRGGRAGGKAKQRDAAERRYDDDPADIEAEAVEQDEAELVQGEDGGGDGHEREGGDDASEQDDPKGVSPRGLRPQESDEQDDDEPEQHDTDRIPPPARPAKRERKPPMRCTHPSCTTTLKHRENYPPPPGFETVCRKHRLEAQKADAGGAAKVSTPRGNVTITKPRRGGAPKKKAPARAAKVSPANGAHGSLTEQLGRAVEAIELVERLGWDRARQLAVMFEEARG